MKTMKVNLFFCVAISFSLSMYFGLFETKTTQAESLDSAKKNVSELLKPNPSAHPKSTPKTGVKMKDKSKTQKLNQGNSALGVKLDSVIHPLPSPAPTKTIQIQSKGGISTSQLPNSTIIVDCSKDEARIDSTTGYQMCSVYSVSNEDSSKNNIDIQSKVEALFSMSSASGAVVSTANLMNYVEKKILFNFDVIKNGEYVYIKGSRSAAALEEGIQGTRYAVNNLKLYRDVGKFVDPELAIEDAFKNVKSFGTKLGYSTVAFEVFSNIYENATEIDSNGNVVLQKEINKSKVATDAIIDVGFGGGGIAASVAIGAYVGSVAPGFGTIIGAGAGLLVGIGYTYLTEGLEINGVSLKTGTKNIANQTFDSKGW